MSGSTRPRAPSISLGQVLDTDFPKPNWISAYHAKDGRQFPQCISHRGYKARYPENTMSAFRGAVEAGTHAIETDIHLTRDDVVVLSHDPTLKRCFGRKERLRDCDWQYVQDLRTIREPRSQMPRLQDLLEYLAQPELQDIWLMLDIKLDNDTEKVMRLIASTLAAVKTNLRPWRNRVVLGIWAPRFLPYCIQYLPGYAVCHIGISSTYGRQFQRIPNISLNINHQVLLGPGGGRFSRDVQKANQPLFVWTVNNSKLMKWSIQKQLDGVITDDPKTFNDICKNWVDDEPEVVRTWAQWLYSIWLYLVLGLITTLLRTKYPGTVETFLRRNDIRTKATLKADELGSS